MSNSYEINRAVRSALFFGAVAAAAGAPVFAQNKSANTEVLQTVVVTGSRIPQPQLQAVSPVQTVNSEAIQQSGVTRVEDLLNTLPQVFSDLGSEQSNGATGTSTVSLRGLGAKRTLVLINGRRLMPGDPTQNGAEAPDLNQIPAALIKRVDVLTGGASAVYGADAVAGVVNFVMDTNFQGVRVDANYSMYQHNNTDTAAQKAVTASGFALPPSSVLDGTSRDITVIMGSNFDDGKGNATVYAGYRRQSALTQARRDFSACSLTTSSGALSCGGSSTSYPGRFQVGKTRYTIDPNNNLVPFAGLYNYAPLNYYIRPDERYTAGFFTHLDVSDHFKPYAEFMFMDDRSKAQIAPSGAFSGAGTGVNSAGVPDGTFLVNCNNPYFSASELSKFCGGNPAAPDVHMIIGRRNIEGGPRTDDLTHTSFRTVVGAKGDINDEWSYDVYGQNGITRLSEEYFNDVSKQRMGYALQAVQLPNGQIVCKANSAGVVAAPGCVPWDIFRIGGVTQAAVNYISVPGLSKGATTERIVSGSVTGELGKYGLQFPTAHNGIAVNFGAEYREEQSELYPDEEFITGDLAGQGAPTLPTIGSFHVSEGFFEARIPFVEDHPFMKSLTADVGYRYSSYSLAFGSTNTYKLGLEWAPVNDVRLRAGYNRAVRAPNIQELFLQNRVQLDGVTDPCAGAKPSATPAQCALTGVTPAEYGNINKNPASQYNGLVGGNPNLKPEKADTYTIGFVITPTILPNFNATVDYYNIKIDNFIASYGADLIMSSCLNSGDPYYCGKINRVQGTGTAADGSIWIGNGGYTVDGISNIGSQRASGVDVTSQYHLDMGRWGGLGFDFDGTYDIKFETTLVPNIGTYSCVGDYGPTCGVPAPKWKHKLRATWRTPIPALDAWATWRYIGGVGFEGLNNTLLAGEAGPSTYPGNHIGSYNYIDLGASYSFATYWTFRAGVNNVMDKDPPIIGAGYLPTVLGSGNTIPQEWDTLGRYIFLNLTANF